MIPYYNYKPKGGTQGKKSISSQRRGKKEEIKLKTMRKASMVIDFEIIQKRIL